MVANTLQPPSPASLPLLVGLRLNSSHPLSNLTWAFTVASSLSHRPFTASQPLLSPIHTFSSPSHPSPSPANTTPSSFSTPSRCATLINQHDDHGQYHLRSDPPCSSSSPPYNTLMQSWESYAWQTRTTSWLERPEYTDIIHRICVLVTSTALAARLAVVVSVISISVRFIFGVRSTWVDGN